MQTSCYLDYILSKVDSKTIIEETLAHVEIDNEMMSDVDEVEEEMMKVI